MTNINSRRQLLWNIGGGLGGLAVAQLLEREALSLENKSPNPAFNGGLHHPAKVKRVIQLFMTLYGLCQLPNRQTEVY